MNKCELLFIKRHRQAIVSSQGLYQSNRYSSQLMQMTKSPNKLIHWSGYCCNIRGWSPQRSKWQITLMPAEKSIGRPAIPFCWRSTFIACYARSCQKFIVVEINGAAVLSLGSIQWVWLVVSDAILARVVDSKVEGFCLQRNTGMGWIRPCLGESYGERGGIMGSWDGRAFTDAVTVPYRTDVYLKSTKVYGIKTVCENNSSFSSHKTKLHLINLHSWSFPHLRYLL